MTPRTFAAIIQDRLQHVEHAIERIEQGAGDITDLSSLRTYLLEILEQLERNPGIEAAADDLYDVAAALVARRADNSHSQGQKRVLREAALRFDERLSTAQPIPKAIKRTPLSPS